MFPTVFQLLWLESSRKGVALEKGLALLIAQFACPRKGVAAAGGLNEMACVYRYLVVYIDWHFLP
jgi:hypothetical protein